MRGTRSNRGSPGCAPRRSASPANERAALLGHYAGLRRLHPDAGSSALRLIELIEGELPRLLATQPDIGRPAQLSLTQSESETVWLNRLAPLTARRRLQAREWLLSEFWILYYRSSGAVYPASARHEREAEYR